MSKNRLEAFSDGVMAIIITIMVLEMKVPHEASLEALGRVFPVFLSYVLSFAYVGIYWNNHHHLLHACEKVSGRVLWANLHLLFWLSLLPFATGWMGGNNFSALPSALYGIVLFAAALAYALLQHSIVIANGESTKLRRALGHDWKGKLSPVLYVAGIVATFFVPAVATVIYVAVAVMWLVPDRRIERAMTDHS